MMAARDLLSAEAGWNALCAWFDQPLPLADGTLTLSAAETPAKESWLRPLGNGVWICLVSFPFQQATQTDLSIGDLAKLPKGLADQVEDEALRIVAAKLPDVLPTPGAAETLGETHLPKDTVWIAALLDLGWAEPVHILISATRTTFGRLAARLPDTAPAHLAAAAVNGVTFALVQALGALDLDLSILASLERGDMLVPSRGPHLTHTAFQILAAPTDDGWVFKEFVMTDETHSGPAALDADAPLDSLDALPVTLTLKIGDVQMTLADLRALNPEALLPLPLHGEDTTAPVQILANGRRWGHGQLIDVEGTPTVRITEINVE